MLASDIPIPFQVNTLPNIEVIRQNVFIHAKVMAIGVASDLDLKRIVFFVIFVCLFFFFRGGGGGGGVETGCKMNLS